MAFEISKDKHSIEYIVYSTIESFSIIID